MTDDSSPGDSAPGSFSGAGPGASPGSVSPRRRRGIRAIVIVVVIGVAVLVGLALVPIPHSFSGSLSSALFVLSEQSLSFPSGSSVSFSWSTTNGDTVAFDLVNSAGTTIYSETASSGSYSFLVNGNAYLFEERSIASATVQFSGTYSVPLI